MKDLLLSEYIKSPKLLALRMLDVFKEVKTDYDRALHNTALNDVWILMGDKDRLAYLSEKVAELILDIAKKEKHGTDKNGRSAGS